jgi:hypothetical protein
MSLMLCGQVYASMDSGTSYLCYKTSACDSREDRLLVIWQRNGEGSNLKMFLGGGGGLLDLP